MEARELELWLGDAIAEKNVREFEQKSDEGERPFLTLGQIQTLETAGLEGHGLTFVLANGAEVVLSMSVGPSEDEVLAAKAKQEMLTVKQATEIIGVSQRTVYNFMKRGRLPSIKLGPSRSGARRVLRSDAEKLRAELEAAGGTDDSIPEGKLTLIETAEWLRYHPNHVRRLALEGRIRYGKTPISGRLHFDADEVLEDLQN